MKSCPGFVFGLVLVLSLGSPAHARRGGAPAGFNGSTGSGGQSCIACHSNVPPPDGMVEIVGAPKQYTLEEIYDLMIRVSDPDQVGAGFQLSVEDVNGNPVGTLTISDPVNTREAPGLPGWITHTSTGVDNAIADWVEMGNSAEYNVQWQAPSEDVGEITFWAAGNAINDDFTPFGDKIYLTNVSAAAGLSIPGDGDGDGDVDIFDYEMYLACVGGPREPVGGVGGTTHDVSVGPGLEFFPADLVIAVGDTVHWFWSGDGLLHNVVSGPPDGIPDGIFNSGPPTSDPETTFDVLFDQAFLDDNPMSGNEYPYFCEVHFGLGMTGTVTVVGDCSVFDFDEDDDVDWSDFGGFQLAFTGSP